MTEVRRWPWHHVALVAGPPTAWLGHLLVSYLLVPPACGANTLPLHATTLVFAAAAIASGVIGVRGIGLDRRRSLIAAAWTGIYVFALLLQGAANTVVGPCG